MLYKHAAQGDAPIPQLPTLYWLPAGVCKPFPLSTANASSQALHDDWKLPVGAGAVCAAISDPGRS